MTRVDFSPSGELLTCVGGTLKIGEQFVDGPDVLDAHWRADGALVWIDRTGVRHVELDEEVERIGEPLQKLTSAVIADDCEHILEREVDIALSTFTGITRWRLDKYKHELAGKYIGSMAVSHDGRLVVIGYETVVWPGGRGWIVFEPVKDRVRHRQWLELQPAPFLASLAFDRTGKRLLVASPESSPSIGVMRVGRADALARTHDGAARAAALDDKGILAAYAYAKGERRLRVDYLEPGVKGPANVAILETLWIEPAVGEIVALAFDRESRRIACLDAGGRVDVVPVP